MQIGWRSGVAYYASLNGADWDVTPLEGLRMPPQLAGLPSNTDLVVRGPSDIWGIASANSDGVSAGPHYDFAHYDGDAWTLQTVPVPQGYAELGVVESSLGLVARESGGLALLAGSPGHGLFFSEWDGQNLSDPIRLGPFESECITMCTGAVHARYLGMLPDGTLAIQLPFARTVSVGKLPD